MEIAREFYSIPHRYILGASESDFQNADGTAKTALQMSMNKFLALERDEDGNVPTVGQFTAYDPAVFTKIIDEHAQLMSSYTGYPPSYFGQTSTANPASADAIRVAENGLVRAPSSARTSGRARSRTSCGWCGGSPTAAPRSHRRCCAWRRTGSRRRRRPGRNDGRHAQAGPDGRDPGHVGRDAEAARLLGGGAAAAGDRPQGRSGRVGAGGARASSRRSRSAGNTSVATRSGINPPSLP
jgi:hypothetical protein